MDSVYCKTFCIAYMYLNPKPTIAGKIRISKIKIKHSNKLNPQQRSWDYVEANRSFTFSLYVICCHKVEKNKGINFYSPYIWLKRCVIICGLVKDQTFLFFSQNQNYNRKIVRILHYVKRIIQNTKGCVMGAGRGRLRQPICDVWLNPILDVHSKC